MTENINKLLLDDERKYLANLMAFEIFLRCKLPEEYVYTENFEEVDKCFSNFKQNYNDTIIKKIRNETKEEKEPQKVLKLLRLEHLLK